MKVRDHIHTIADILLGALHAHRRSLPCKRAALAALLCDLIVRPELPTQLALQIESFSPERFSLRAAAQTFLHHRVMSPRRLLELTVQLCMADGELDLDDDDYIHALAHALELEPGDYDDLVLDYEVLELERPSQTVERCAPYSRAHDRLATQLSDELPSCA